MSKLFNFHTLYQISLIPSTAFLGTAVLRHLKSLVSLWYLVERPDFTNLKLSSSQGICIALEMSWSL